MRMTATPKFIGDGLPRLQGLRAKRNLGLEIGICLKGHCDMRRFSLKITLAVRLRASPFFISCSCS